MQADLVEIINRKLIDRFGITFRSDFRKEKEGLRILLRPEGVPLDEGFTISILVGWKKLTLQFIIGDKAGLLLIAMGRTGPENKAVFCAIAKNLLSINSIIDLIINGKSMHIGEYDGWPDYWQNFQLQLKSPIIDTDGDLVVNEGLDELILIWTSSFLSMVLPLLPLEEEKISQEISFEGLPEGALTKILVNRYERNKVNRQACISIYGAKCLICDFDFGKKYGSVGEGFIEVHHNTPLAQMTPDYHINPITDLVPLCSNCHSMVHRSNPPYSIDQIHQLIKESSLT